MSEERNMTETQSPSAAIAGSDAARTPERGAGYTRFQATIRIEDLYGFNANEAAIKETLANLLEEDLDCEVLEITDIHILAQE